MCGIFGYVGKENSIDACLSGLKQLEYRGYDSAGIAGIKDGKILTMKEVGKIANLENKIKLTDINLDFAISHTRWATHGRANELNAHPHVDIHSTLALVHNGIIENHTQVRNFLNEKGVKFVTETDTEVIAQLIAYYYTDDLLTAIKKALSELRGSFAIAMIHKDWPQRIFGAARESPLCVGINREKKETFISSDPNAFLGKTLDITYLSDDELVMIDSENIQIFDKNLHPMEKSFEIFSSDSSASSKGGFEHFMLKEIFEQPQSVKKAMHGRILQELGTAHFEHMCFSPEELKGVKHILIIACGTSWHAGCIAAAMLEEKARIPTQAEIASELRFKNPIISKETLVIAISQSGETADTIAAVREAKAKGAKVLGICNVKNSTLTREADSTLFIKAGPEISVCSTKAFTSQIMVLSLFALYMARLRDVSREEGKLFLKELSLIPQKIKRVLQYTHKIEMLAKKYAKYENFFFLGRRYMYATCLEAALKLKEISYLNANGYAAGELKHGPIALISKDLPVVAFCANKQTYEKMLSNLFEVKARNAPLLVFAHEGAEGLEKVADDIVFLPDTFDETATFISSIAGQLFAYFIAKERNTDIDRPRNLAKSVTVE